MRNKTSVLALSLLWSALFATGAFAANSAGEPGRESGKKNPLNNVYFGEEHLHTNASPDAFAFGTRTDANDAYRYAKGEAIKESQSGKMIQKRTPYDWAAVTDHSEYLGMMPLLLDPKSPLQKTEIGMPHNEVPLALLMFNIGVETGQVMFVVAVSLLPAGLHRMYNHSALSLARVTPYVIGGVAAFWTIERTVSSFAV